MYSFNGTPWILKILVYFKVIEKSKPLKKALYVCLYYLLSILVCCVFFLFGFFFVVVFLLLFL